MSLIRPAILFATLGSVAFAASPAAARFTPHPRRTEVNGRLFNQERRINAGVRDGQLTRTEAHALRKDDRGVYREKSQMAKLDGGRITKADQRALNQQETAVSKDIKTDRHN